MASQPTTAKPRPNPARLPPDRGQVIVQQQQERHEIFIGPLPHPDILRQYNELQPGFAERLLALTEQEADHRRGMERNSLAENSAEVRRGQVFALIIGLGGLAASVLAAYFNQPWVGGVLGGGTLVGLVSAFILGRVIKAS